LYKIERQGYFAIRRFSPYKDEASRLIRSLTARLTAPAVVEALQHCETRRHGKEDACLHSLRDLYYLPDILELLPGAKMLLLIRDPRAFLASQQARWRRNYMSPRPLPWTFMLQACLNYHPFTYRLLWMRAAMAADV
jgi:hypothetical protein